jgi:hypothetical protein
MHADASAGSRADWRKTGRDCLILLIVAAALMAPEWVFGMRDTNSASYSLIWTREYGEALTRGELYPRWFPDSFQGLGSPVFYFYPPLAYFVCGLLHALGLGLVKSITAASTAIFFASGASMYAWLRWKGARPLLGAVIYMIAPYRLLDVYSRGAIAEHAAFVWFPLIALGIEALPRRWAIPFLAAAWGGLLITHLPMALLAFCLLIAPLAALRLRASPTAIWPGVTAGLAGVGLSAFYLLPALTLQDRVKLDLLSTPFFQPAHWFIWNWGAGMSFELVAEAIACVALLVAAARPASVWFWLTVAAVAVSFGIVPITAAPILSSVQFPWRALGLVLFFAATAIALSPPKRLVGALALCLLTPAYLGLGRDLAQAIAVHDQPPLASIMREMPDAPEYLPRGFVMPAQGYPDLSVYSNLTRGEAIKVTRPGHYVFGRFAFPIWRVTHNGVETPTYGPLLGFDGVPGDYRIERRLLWQEIVGALVSALALIFVLVCAFLARPHRRSVGQPA